MRDITERKRAEEKLKESNNYIDTIIKTSVDGIFVVDTEGKFEYGNVAFSKILGWPMDELIGEPFMKVIPEDKHEFMRMRWEEIQQGISKPYEAAIVTKNGSRRDIFVSNNKVKIKGEVKYVVVIKDATEQKQAQEQIIQSLKEKEILLREIHHRVKNNLMIVSSLLAHQSQYIRDKNVIDMFIESQNRILSIALVHEKLYQSKNLAKIDFNEYISDMIADVIQTFEVNGSKITLNMNIENIPLDIDFATPCGLIINELVTNSLKYAFPAGTGGEIKIAFRSIGETMLELVVSDDGIGIPKDLDFRKTESLGLHLVTTLAENQLHGEINLNRIKGTEFKIKFRGIK
ncbi:MAG: PAS domain S-box protein [Candidatus Methanoperedens sp.]|nr:PAS domain S-box protein [Candidatus Methanoperedens sp.]MCZ7369089.1 PAS domain S-box protein [Candidatus Methanoperedens sp.]